MTTQRGRKGRSRRKGWLASIWSRGSGDDEAELEYDLVVLEGADAKATFPVDRPEIQIGRAAPGSKGSAGIQLTDRSVSSKHALLSRENGRITIQHLPSATNPTLVNGRRIKRKRIRDGDRIVLGLVVLELRARRIAPAASARALDRVPQAQIATDPLNVMAEIVLREGVGELRGERFPLVRRRTSIGRDEDCDIVLEVSSISRNHAALVWEDDQLILIHESAVNPLMSTGRRSRTDGASSTATRSGSPRASRSRSYWRPGVHPRPSRVLSRLRWPRKTRPASRVGRSFRTKSRLASRMPWSPSQDRTLRPRCSTPCPM